MNAFSKPLPDYTRDYANNLDKASYGQYSIGTTLQREFEGEPVTLDILVWFDATSYTPGCPMVHTQRNGDPGWPAEPAEYEFAISAIQIDGSPTDDASWPLTDAERARVSAWFENNQDRASQIADENDGDDYGDRADYEYDRWRDDRMGGL